MPMPSHGGTEERTRGDKSSLGSMNRRIPGVEQLAGTTLVRGGVILYGQGSSTLDQSACAGVELDRVLSPNLGSSSMFSLGGGGMFQTRTPRDHVVKSGLL